MVRLVKPILRPTTLLAAREQTFPQQRRDPVGLPRASARPAAPKTASICRPLPSVAKTSAATASIWPGRDCVLASITRALWIGASDLATADGKAWMPGASPRIRTARLYAPLPWPPQTATAQIRRLPRPGRRRQDGLRHARRLDRARAQAEKARGDRAAAEQGGEGAGAARAQAQSRKAKPPRPPRS